MTLLSSGVAFCSIIWMLFSEARKRQWSRWTAFFTVLICVSGTQLLVFASVLNSHVIAAALLLYFWLREKRDAAPGLSGFVIGAAVVIDPLSVTFIGAWLIKKRKSIFTRERFGFLLVGGLVPILVHSVICWSVSGNWLSLNLNPEHFQF